MVEDNEYLEQNDITTEEALDNDEVSAEEDGFLRGYDEESEPDEEFGIDSDIDDNE